MRKKLLLLIFSILFLGIPRTFALDPNIPVYNFNSQLIKDMYNIFNEEDFNFMINDIKTRSSSLIGNDDYLLLLDGVNLVYNPNKPFITLTMMKIPKGSTLKVYADTSPYNSIYFKLSNGGTLHYTSAYYTKNLDTGVVSVSSPGTSYMSYYWFGNNKDKMTGVIDSSLPLDTVLYSDFSNNYIQDYRIIPFNEERGEEYWKRVTKDSYNNALLSYFFTNPYFSNDNYLTLDMKNKTAVLFYFKDWNITNTDDLFQKYTLNGSYNYSQFQINDPKSYGNSVPWGQLPNTDDDTILFEPMDTIPIDLTNKVDFEFIPITSLDEVPVNKVHFFRNISSTEEETQTIIYNDAYLNYSFIDENGKFEIGNTISYLSNDGYTKAITTPHPDFISTLSLKNYYTYYMRILEDYQTKGNIFWSYFLTFFNNLPKSLNMFLMFSMLITLLGLLIFFFNR